MNIAVIFAGGSGKRMNSVSRPKQFLELHGKPVIIYTLELFDNHPEIDAICIVCLESWMNFLKKQLKKFEISKDFKYENLSEKKLKDLIEIIKKENLYEGNKEILDSLENKLKHNTETELNKFRKDVSEMLSAEIVKRYYFSKGEAEQFLKTDEVLELSIEILNDPKRYNEILQGK